MFGVKTKKEVAHVYTLPSQPKLKTPPLTLFEKSTKVPPVDIRLYIPQKQLSGVRVSGTLPLSLLKYAGKN
jgi:hypothetical protein